MVKLRLMMSPPVEDLPHSQKPNGHGSRLGRHRESQDCSIQSFQNLYALEVPVLSYMSYRYFTLPCVYLSAYEVAQMQTSTQLKHRTEAS